MTQIDTSRWAAFDLNDLFDFSLPKGDLQVQKVKDGDIPLITPSNTNNGLIQRISDKSESTLYEANELTVDMFGNAYYQDVPFYVTAHGHVNVLRPKFMMNKYLGLFLATSIKTMFMQKYGFADMCTQKVLRAEKIKLPVTDEGVPNWSYMEDFIRSKEACVKESIASILSSEITHRNKIETQKWKEFEIGEYFEIIKGKRLTKANMKPGNVRFIGSSAFNNGTTAYISNEENRHNGNLITVCYNGSVGETFYQEEEFIASDDVNILYPKFKMSKHIALFLCPIIKAKGKNYEFVDKWTKEKMEKTKILLPAKDDGKPDWEHIEKYMLSLEKRVQDNIAILNT